MLIARLPAGFESKGWRLGLEVTPLCSVLRLPHNPGAECPYLLVLSPPSRAHGRYKSHPKCGLPPSHPPWNLTAKPEIKSAGDKTRRNRAQDEVYYVYVCIKSPQKVTCSFGTPRDSSQASHTHPAVPD